MTLLTIAPIVEGHGEVVAIRLLLERVAVELLKATTPIVLRPIRVSKSKIVGDEEELLRSVDLAALKLQQAGERGLILLLMDADSDAACQLAPKLMHCVQTQRGHLDVACIIAVVEYETWFVAAAESLQDYWIDAFSGAIPSDPESVRAGKGWVQQFYRAPRYSETVDQVKLTAAFDLAAARERSSSFDKLCRELSKRMTPIVS